MITAGSDAVPSKRWLTTGQVARRLGLNPKTIRRRIYDGTIPAWQIADGSEWRIPGWWVDEQLAKIAPIRRKK